MAINKKKNKLIQITFPIEDAEHLETISQAFNKEGVKVTKSEILLASLRMYIRSLVSYSELSKKVKEEEPQKEKKDA